MKNLGDIHKAHIFSKINFDKWIQWAQATDSQQIPAYKWILPPQNIVDEIATKIGVSTPIIAGTKEFLIYSINAGITNWEKVPLACRNHIFPSNGNPIRENLPSFEIFEILTWLT